MKLKNLYLVLFMLCMSTAIFAQDKYEQAIVAQGPNILYITIEGKEMEKEKIKSDPGDFSAVLKELSTLRNDGWEVWNSTFSAGGGVVYFLRRKLK